MFKAGDRVRCVDAGDCVRLREGTVYTVREATDDFVWVEGLPTAYFTDRFDSIVEAKPPLGAVPTAAQLSRLRKMQPILSGVLQYFPDAVADVARLSKLGNEKHNPGQAMHWAREKSTDHGDCIIRHTITAEELDYDFGPGNEILHATAAAWRALANLQTIIEKMRAEGKTYPPIDPTT